MIVDILLFKNTDKVIVFPEKIDFVNGTTFPHSTTIGGVIYHLKKHEYNEKNYLIGVTDGVKKDDINSAIDEFKPAPL